MMKTKNQEDFCKLLLSQNITKELPEFNSISPHVKSLALVIQDALDYGHERALYILKQNINKETKNKRRRKRKNDPWAYSLILRMYVQQYLLDKGEHTKLDEQDGVEHDWEINELPNLGLAGNFDGRNYRILKGRGGILPSLGLSNKRKTFYRQDHMLNPYLIPDDKRPLLYNVIFLWDIDQKNYINLYLSCPCGWKNGIAFDYFTELLPHSALTVITKVTTDEFPEDQSEIVVERINELQGKLL